MSTLTSNSGDGSNGGRGGDGKPPNGGPCPSCAGVNTRFRYFNNRKKEQPRYVCRGCGRMWTLGGRIRRPYVKRNGKAKKSVKQPAKKPRIADTESQPPVAAAAETSTTMPEQSGLMHGSEGGERLSKLDVLAAAALLFSIFSEDQIEDKAK